MAHTDDSRTSKVDIERKNIVVRLSPLAEPAFDSLSPVIRKALLRKIGLIKENPNFGEPIAKRKIPPEYKHLGIVNLFHVALPSFWRMLYSLTHDPSGRIVIVVDILDHKKYNKKFGYRG